VKNIISFYIFCISLFITNGIYSKQPNLLITIYSNNNPEILSSIYSYYQKLSNEVPYHFLVIYDESDEIISHPEIKNELENLPNLSLFLNKNKTKTSGYNTAIKKYIDWFDIVFILEDNFYVSINHFDKIIADSMVSNYPDFDGVLNFNYNTTSFINKTPAIGKKYYNRFGYIFHDEYQSSFYDHELTYVSRILGKETFINKSLATATPKTHYNETDKNLLEQRRDQTFNIKQTTLKHIFNKDWSILICTLFEREKEFSYIYSNLLKQIQDNHLEDKIEILFYKDNRAVSIGHKRNALLKKSKGMYINFIDDDDDIHPHYIKMIYEKLQNKPDCISLHGIITFNGMTPTLFIHSIKYNSYFNSNGVYFRPPNHLNTIKRSIASQFIFPSISYYEDTNWAMKISKSKLLKKEEEITQPYYFYKYVSNK
jgi:hypothetical protein